MSDLDVPSAVSCPCGKGEADHIDTIVESRARRLGAERCRRLTVNYRHVEADCPIGGAIVIDDGETVATVGPLFDERLARDVLESSSAVVVDVDVNQEVGIAEAD